MVTIQAGPPSTQQQLFVRSSRWGNSNNNNRRGKASNQNRQQHHLLPPVGAVVLAALVLAGSCFLSYQQHARQHHEDMSAEASRALHHSTPSSLSILEWCQSHPQCLKRLEALRSKMELEDWIYQEQYKIEQARTQSDDLNQKQQTKEEILEAIRSEIEAEQVLDNEGNQENAADYKHRPEWVKGGSFPELTVIGNPKTSASQLYKILASHVDVVTGKVQVSFCNDQDDLERRLLYQSSATASAKFFVLLRDPADWAWAIYNSYSNSYWEDNDTDLGGVFNETWHYRSPEIFHELVLSGNKSILSKPFSNLKRQFLHDFRRIRVVVGKENFIVLKTEDLQQSRLDSSGLLERIVEATGLSLDGFDDKILQQNNLVDDDGEDGIGNINRLLQGTDRRTGHRQSDGNKKLREQTRHTWTNSSSTVYRDFKASSNNNNNMAFTVGGYPVSHFRPMFESTRKFLYLQWHKECTIWAKEFGVEYSDCLAAISDDDK